MGGGRREEGASGLQFRVQVRLAVHGIVETATKISMASRNKQGAIKSCHILKISVVRGILPLSKRVASQSMIRILRSPATCKKRSM